MNQIESIFLTFLQHVSNEHGSSSYMRIEQNDSANEEEAIDDESTALNAVNDTKYHSNMSDITNIQMQLDNIKVIQIGDKYNSIVRISLN